MLVVPEKLTICEELSCFPILWTFYINTLERTEVRGMESKTGLCYR